MFNRDKLLSEINKKGWSRYRLSKESNVAQTTLRDIFGEKKVTPSTKTLEKLASALEVPISAFFDDEEKITNEDNITDKDIRRIERARSKMKLEDKEKMMKILELSFEEYFDDED